jgi:hypothetical protein
VSADRTGEPAARACAADDRTARPYCQPSRGTAPVQARSTRRRQDGR